MESKLNLKTLVYIFLSLCWIGSGDLLSQPLISDIQAYDLLVFEKSETKEMRFIRSGAKIRYRLYSQPSTVQKGILQKVTMNAMFVDVIEVTLSDCMQISGRVKTKKELTGGILLGLGLGSLPFGATLAQLRLDGKIIIGGPILVGASVALIGTGIYLISSYKTFKMTKGWSVYGGRMEYGQVLTPRN